MKDVHEYFFLGMSTFSDMSLEVEPSDVEDTVEGKVRLRIFSGLGGSQLCEVDLDPDATIGQLVTRMKSTLKPSGNSSHELMESHQLIIGCSKFDLHDPYCRFMCTKAVKQALIISDTNSYTLDAFLIMHENSSE